MVLFVDSNKFRREKLARRCRTSDLPSMAIEYGDYGCYMKPLVTVLVDPQRSFMKELKRNENTLFVVVVKREEYLSLYPDMVVVYDGKGEISPEKIKEIIKTKTEYNLFDDYANFVNMSWDVNEAYCTGARLYLSKTDFKILKFFFYNYGKIFRYDEIFEYLHYTGRIIEKTFDGYTQRINRRCIENAVENVIAKRKTGYEMPILTGDSPRKYNKRLNVLLI